jgi:hypothetical protein
MSVSAGVVEASEAVIREIEAQLDTLLSRKRNDIEQALAARIRREQEETRLKIEDMEKEFDREKQGLHDYRVLVAEVEAERNGILDDVQEILKRALGLQSQIEAMAKQTVEEIQRVVALQDKLESLRRKTAEQAGFLKKTLDEKFGIAAGTSGGGEAGAAGIDLDQELEKLRRIKSLLADKSLRGTVPRPPEARPDGESLPGLDLEDGWKVRIPEIRELTQSALPEDESGAEPPSAEVRADEFEFERPVGEPPASETLDLLRKTETGDGAADIAYFQRGDRIVLDAGRLSRAIEAAVEEAEGISLKLDGCGPVKEQFFVKQDLIYTQESLRRLVQRVVRLCDRAEPVFPERIRDIFNLEVLKGMQDKLSTGNWADPGDLKSFAEDARALRSVLVERSGSPEDEAQSILSLFEET